MEIENFKELESFLDEEIVFEGSKICTKLNKYDLMRLCEGYRKNQLLLNITRMETPEALMKEGFESFFKARESFEKAAIEYDKAAGYETLNGENVKSAIHFMARAYDEVSAIWENDINV